MNKSIVIFFTLLLLLTLVPFSQAEWLFNGKTITDSPFAKTDGDFGAMLQFTDDAAALFKAWDQDNSAVETNFVEKIRKGQKLTAVILFSNCAANKKGNANVTAQLYLISPKNEIIHKSKEIEVWVNKPAPQYRDLELSVDSLTITISDEELAGIYTVKALVIDNIAQKSLELEHQFEVIDK